MPRNEATVRVESLDGTWEVLGADKARGITPENIQYSHDQWGSATASFVVKRNVGVPWPDLTAFTPVDIWVGGVKCWSGRVDQTPTTDSPDARQIAVACKGWQYHLDDDVFEGKYVHTRISEWQDLRTFPTAELSNTKAAAAGAVNGGGTLQLALPNGQVFGAGAYAGVCLDLGPSNTAASVSVTYETSGEGGYFLIARGHTAPDSVAWTANDAFNTELSTLGASGSTRGTFATASRYVLLYLTVPGGATPASDISVKLTAIKVFTDDSYRSTDDSALTADLVVLDALSEAAPLLSTDTSQVGSGSFAIPDYAPDGYRTAREHIASVNAYENYIAMVDVDQRPVYRSRESSPVVEVGAWSGATFEDASANSAQDIYNRALVEGTGPDGSPLRVERSAGEQTTAILAAISSPAPDNPSFDTDTTSWTDVTRDTGTFDTTPASGRMTGATPTETFTGTFQSGVTYVLTFKLRLTFVPLIVTFGTATDNAALYVFSSTPGAFVEYRVAWSPSADRTGVTVSFETGFLTPPAGNYIDTLLLHISAPTLVDRRGFRRSMILQSPAAMTTTGGQTLGDRYLSNHRATPLKGSLKVTGPTGVRRVQGGTPVHPSQLGLLTNQVIRLAHRIDFDNGNVGKDGTIVQVSYDHNAETASIEVDNQSGNFEALLSRLAITVGQVTT